MGSVNPFLNLSFLLGGLPEASFLRTAQVATDMTESCGFVWFPVKTSVQWAQKVKVCGQSWGHFSAWLSVPSSLTDTVLGICNAPASMVKGNSTQASECMGQVQEGEQSLREVLATLGLTGAP